MDEVIASVERADARVLVRGPRDAIDMLAQLGGPFLEVLPTDAPLDSAPSVRVVSGAPAGAGWTRIALASEYEPDRVLWANERLRAIALVNESSAWRDQQLLRSVRHLLRWQTYAAGDLFVHGGLIRHHGGGILVAGGKKSGKTSTILSALLHGGADFVSNDDVTITEQDGEPVGYGWPRTLNIRTDVLLALARSSPEVRQLLSVGRHPTNRYPGRHRTEEAVAAEDGAPLPSSVWIRCVELATVFGCGLAPASPISAVVFPRFEAGVGAGRVVRLDEAEARATLLSNVESEATKYDPFLAGWFPHSDVERRNRLLERLLAGVPCYRLIQDMAQLGASTELLIGAVA